MTRERYDKRLILVSGPASVGKNPLLEALIEAYGETFRQQFGEVVFLPLIKAKESRPDGPRPAERKQWNNPDYFRWAKEIEALKRDPRHMVGYCRDLPQAFNLENVAKRRNGLFLCEIYHTIGRTLRSNGYIDGKVDARSVFLSPLSEKDIVRQQMKGVDWRLYVTAKMAGQLAVRSYKFGEDVYAQSVIDENIKRAIDAPSELESAPDYTHTLVNKYWEGHPHLTGVKGLQGSKPERCVYRTIDALAEICLTGDSDAAEHWDKGMFDAKSGNPKQCRAQR
jgi:hypothetical protein